MRTTMYMNVNTGEVTDNHNYAVKEFYNKGDDVELLLYRNGKLVNKGMWVHE